jgi:diketogulonate reductase-like aldo/keto reductase
VTTRREQKEIRLKYAIKEEDLDCIPGTKRRSYLEVNAEAVHLMLTPAEITELDALGAASGPRYPERAMAMIERCTTLG